MYKRANPSSFSANGIGEEKPLKYRRKLVGRKIVSYSEAAATTTTKVTKESEKERIPTALTVAGSDSGGGAGIQADLKTFAALGVHGMSAITAVTAQNTKEVTEIFDIPPEMISSQIEAVHSDIGVNAAKTGMLHNTDTITAVSESLRDCGLEKVVVDPVMVSKSGALLLERSAISALLEKLLPIAYVVTPNSEEAQVLCNMKTKISNLNEARIAAKKISEYGPKVVVVKGGHLERTGKNKGMAIDLVYMKEERKTEFLKSDWYETKNTHGTGCVFSAAITAELSKGKDVMEALKSAKSFVSKAIRNSLEIGQGYGPVNPSREVLHLAQKFITLSNVSEAVEILEANGALVSKLIPESRSNIGMAIEGAKEYNDIAAIPGRITNPFGNRVSASAPPAFGASRHIANTILAAMQYNSEMRSAMNIKYDKELISSCRKLGLVVSSYNREQEPTTIKKKEGATTFWGATKAISESKKFPDVIYHEGDFGKEPMIVLLGKDAVSVAQKAVNLAKISPEKATEI
jgi:hydroxymethylpyrimidine kinase/phosphomethylpyrimidine kinase